MSDRTCVALVTAKPVINRVAQRSLNVAIKNKRELLNPSWLIFVHDSPTVTREVVS